MFWVKTKKIKRGLDVFYAGITSLLIFCFKCRIKKCQTRRENEADLA